MGKPRSKSEGKPIKKKVNSPKGRDEKSCSRRGDSESEGNEFLKLVANLILVESRLVGNGKFMKSTHPKIIDFKYPEQVEASMDMTVGEKPASYSSLMQFCRQTIAHSLRTNHPRYMNSLYGGVDQYGIASSWLTDCLNSSAANWESSPVFTILERKTVEILGKFTGWSEVDGLYCPGGSMANGYAMLLARQTMFPEIKENGVFGLPKLTLFVSDQAHYSFKKMAILLGMGTGCVIPVKSDNNGRMLPDELNRLIEESLQKKERPFMVAATSGTTVFGAMDPLIPISEICNKHKLWFHVDGAFGGIWLMCKKHRKLLDGIEKANSLTWDLHKTLSIPIYCTLILTSQKGVFSKKFNLKGEYLFQFNKYYNTAYDKGDESIQCTRKVESFKLFLFLKAHGLSNIDHHIENIFNMARYFENQISNRPNWRLVLNPSEANNICFFFIPDAYINKEVDSLTWAKIACELKRKMMEKGSLMVAYQTIENKKIPCCFRLTISMLPVYTKEDIDHVINEFELLGKPLVV